MKRFWLVLFPDTFLWVKNSNGLIYNTNNFKHSAFPCTDEIYKLCISLLDIDSLYSIEIDDSVLSNKDTIQWVDKLISIEAGCLIEQDGQNKKLISYIPLLRIQNDINRIILKHSLNIGGDIIENIHELVFYLNGSIHGSNKYCKQTCYPLKSNTSLDFNQVESFVNQCSNRMLNQITLVGNLVNYKDYRLLQKWILSNEYFIHVILHAEDLENDITKQEWFNFDKVNTTIIVANYSEFSLQIELYQNFPDKVTLAFPVSSKKEFDCVSSILQETNLKNFNIIPLYNGTNKKFFEEYVYMTTDEFNCIELSKREVFVNMTMNTYFFGKLTILPDGKIYSNVNTPPLGSIGDPIYDMIYKEMTERKTWFLIRDMKPCCDCVYQWLCPSPGNYELVMGKPNLCHINN